MDSLKTGFGLTTGAIIAVVVIGLIIVFGCCVCCVGLAMLDSSTNEVYQNILDEMDQPSRPTRRLVSTPEAPPGPTSTPIIYEFQGHGDDFVTFQSPGSGLAQFSISHRGESNFAVKLLNPNGDLIDLLVNEIGNYDGKRTAQIGPGEYVLEITADGGWSIVMAPPQ